MHRDPGHTGMLRKFITRNTPHVFGIGALQRLAEEMTDDLQAIRDAAAERACRTGRVVRVRLRAKGVDFGRVTLVSSRGRRNGAGDGAVVVLSGGGDCEVLMNVSRLDGVDPDLVVKPLQWKGTDSTVRIFNRGASHDELGMQPVEIVGDGVDGDYDGVTDEMTIGDQTALAIYLAAQPRPVTKVELAEVGLIAPLTEDELASIERGGEVFEAIGCADCHRPALVVDDPVFSEPSQNPNYREDVFPAGQPGLDPDRAVTFDLTRDQPDNIVETPAGEVHLGVFESTEEGGAIVRLFGDLKRHDMGPELAESIDEGGTGASTWMTKELWGVADTGPYLHDGRATTITEAILAHGGEGHRSRQRFHDATDRERADLIAFLGNLKLLKLEEEEE